MAQKLYAENCDGWDKAGNERVAILGLAPSALGEMRNDEAGGSYR